jgi:hypothetical protein
MAAADVGATGLIIGISVVNLLSYAPATGYINAFIQSAYYG